MKGRVSNRRRRKKKKKKARNALSVPEITASLEEPCSSLAILSASSISIIPKPCECREARGGINKAETGALSKQKAFCVFVSLGISHGLGKLISLDYEEKKELLTCGMSDCLPFKSKIQTYLNMHGNILSVCCNFCS